MERILVVNVNWLGDVIFSSPVFKALKEAHPNARISCLAVPRVKEILESIPFIDEIIEYDERGRHRNPFAKLKLIIHLRRRRFNVAFLLHRSFTRALIVYLAGIPQRVGYDEKNRGKLLTHIVEHLEDQVHRSDHYLNVIESFGIPVNDRRSQLNVDDKAKSDVDKLLLSNEIQGNDYLVVINPGGNWNLKRWPTERFSRLVFDLFVKKDAKIVVSGTQKDRSLSKIIRGSSLECAIDLTGQTDLKQLMCLMKRANLVISADSGPLHIASGVSANCIGIYGPTRPEITGPRGIGVNNIIQHDVGCNREPCYNLKCPDNVCMQSVTVNDVEKIIEQVRNS